MKYFIKNNKGLCLGLLAILILGFSLVFGLGDCFAQDRDSGPPTLAQLIDAATDTAISADSMSARDLSLVPFELQIRRAAKKYNLSPSWLAAFIQIESGWEPWATRTEPHYKTNRVVQRDAKSWSKRNKGLPTTATELDDRSQSMGLMQVMAQKARELGLQSKYAAELYNLDTAIEYGARVLKEKLRRYDNDTLKAISAYNAGSPTVANARYVYQITIAEYAYRKVFNRNKRYNETRTAEQRDNRSMALLGIHNFSPGDARQEPTRAVEASHSDSDYSYDRHADSIRHTDKVLAGLFGSQSEPPKSDHSLRAGERTFRESIVESIAVLGPQGIATIFLFVLGLTLSSWGHLASVARYAVCLFQSWRFNLQSRHSQISAPSAGIASSQDPGYDRHYRSRFTRVI